MQFYRGRCIGDEWPFTIYIIDWFYEGSSQWIPSVQDKRTGIKSHAVILFHSIPSVGTLSEFNAGIAGIQGLNKSSIIKYHDIFRSVPETWLRQWRWWGFKSRILLKMLRNKWAIDPNVNPMFVSLYFLACTGSFRAIPAILRHNQLWPNNFIIACQPGRNLYGFQLTPGLEWIGPVGWPKAQTLKVKDVPQSGEHNKILAAEQQYKINTD